MYAPRHIEIHIDLRIQPHVVQFTDFCVNSEDLPQPMLALRMSDSDSESLQTPTTTSMLSPRSSCQAHYST
jgi:hypothetical protein